MVIDEGHDPQALPKSTRISILGLRRSGKTTFLTVLQRALVSADSRWKLVPRGRDNKERLNVLVNVLFGEGLYPEATSELESVPEIIFDVKSNADYLGGNPGDEFELRTADVPGSAVKGIQGEGTDKTFYEDYVKNSAAIVFLIDPQERCKEEEDLEKKGDYYYPLFFNILNELSELSAQKMYAAFCITKADIYSDAPKSFIEEGYWDDSILLEEKFTEILGSGVVQSIRSVFEPKKLRWCAISATGYYYDEKNEKWISQYAWDAVSKDPHIVDPRNLKPLGVAEVMEWIFDAISKEHNRERGISIKKILEHILH